MKSDEARIGERIHEIVKLDTIIDDGHDLYADQASLDAGRPLDFPRLLFVLLVRELPSIKLWHSHYGDTVTLVRGDEEATFTVPPIDSRDMLLLYTRQLVKDILA